MKQAVATLQASMLKLGGSPRVTASPARSTPACRKKATTMPTTERTMDRISRPIPLPLALTANWITWITIMASTTTSTNRMKSLAYCWNFSQP